MLRLLGFINDGGIFVHESIVQQLSRICGHITNLRTL